jgi:hypothetical protein
MRVVFRLAGRPWTPDCPIFRTSHFVAAPHRRATDILPVVFEVRGVRDGRGCANSVIVYSFVDFKSGGVGSAGMETCALFPAQLLLARTLSALTVLVVAHWSHSICLYRRRVKGCCQYWSGCLATCRVRYCRPRPRAEYFRPLSVMWPCCLAFRRCCGVLLFFAE